MAADRHSVWSVDPGEAVHYVFSHAAISTVLAMVAMLCSWFFPEQVKVVAAVSLAVYFVWLCRRILCLYRDPGFEVGYFQLRLRFLRRE